MRTPYNLPESYYEPHFMKSDGGYNLSEYWRVFAQCSDGTIVSGIGKTPKECQESAKKQVEIHEAFLKLPDMEKLKRLVDADVVNPDECLRLVTKILVEHENLILHGGRKSLLC